MTELTYKHDIFRIANLVKYSMMSGHQQSEVDVFRSIAELLEISYDRRF